MGVGITKKAAATINFCVSMSIVRTAIIRT